MAGVALITPQVRCGCLRGRLCVAGVALADMDVHFVWQAWRLWRSAALRGDIDLAGSGGALGSGGGGLRGRRGAC